MPKFCPTCGNSSDKIPFYGNFCQNCTTAKFTENLKETVDVVRCKRCGRIKVHGAFVPPNGKNLGDAINQTFKNKEVHLIDYAEDTALVDLSEQTPKGTITIEHRLNIVYKRTMCEVCYKKACQYHEAVIQLRGNIQKIEKFMQKLTKFFDYHDQFITKIEIAENGIDVYLSSKSLASAFIARLKLHPETSYTLSGVGQNGKKVYKNTYAIRY